MTKKVETKETSIFEEDNGVTRGSTMNFNAGEVEAILVKARKYLDDHKGGKPAKIDLVKIEQMLGVAISNSNNFAWAFSPHNKNAPFSELAAKYGVRVGAHLGKLTHEKQSNYFKEMTKSENRL
jgi:hypothetical protein